MSNSKACRVCRQTKSLSQFRTNGKYTRSECRDCEKNLAKKRRAENPEAQKEADRRYHAKNPDKRKELWNSYYSRHREQLLEQSKQWREANKQKVTRIYKEYRQNNKEKLKAYSKEYQKRNPEIYVNSYQKRRTLLRDGGIYDVKASEIKAILKQPCFYCGSRERISIDHVIPISRGGMHRIGNLVSACLICNSSKNNKFIMEWRCYA